MKTCIDLGMTNLRLFLQYAGDRWPKFRFALRACATSALLVTGLLFALRALSYADTLNLTGTYMADDGGVYYIQQSGTTLWWIGLSVDSDLPFDQVFHRGLGFTNMFRGEVRSDNTIVGFWVDVSRGTSLNSGTLTLQISPASGGAGGSSYQLTALIMTGGFGGNQWNPIDPISDAPDMYERFSDVQKNHDHGSLYDNGLKPFRDQTVFYGRVASKHLNLGNYDEPPHFVDTTGDRSYHTFICDDSSGNDHDLEINIGVDRNRFERGFLAFGWDGRNPPDVTQKLFDNTAQGPGGLLPNEGYIHAEGLMYGRTADCDDSSAGRVLFPGWADKGGNSILLNGRPIDAADHPDNFQLAYGYDVNTQSYYVEGMRINNQLLLPGDQIRIIGSLILDCGHGGDCHEDQTYADNDGAQNQEIHPIYSIDIIRPPLGPGAGQARQNLTGAWGANDGGTFYVRQIGNTFWMLGIGRDREALVPHNDVPIPTYASVYQGTITYSPDGYGIIEGSGITVPYATENETLPFTAALMVNANRKEITTIGCLPFCPNALPIEFSKLYEPEDTTPPQSNLAIGAPHYPAVSSQPFVTNATQLTVTATDSDSGVQNVWYRFFPNGSSNPPPYTSVAGSSATFTLTGQDGLYEVDTYATDNAGNDETPIHVQLVYLDNTAPVATITAPAATQYGHSDSSTISYNVSDGAGSGVQSATPLMDNSPTLNDANHTVVANGLLINLLTQMALGPHTFSVNTLDNVNNAGSKSVTFTIVVTAESIKGDVNQFLGGGKIKNSGEANSLLAKLNAAAQARARGDCKTAATDYQAFINELQAQSGKGVDAAAASIMIGDAQYLIGHCP